MDAKSFLFVILSTFQPADIEGINPEEAYCLAVNIYHESQGENAPGKAAVAAVTMTRVDDDRYPSSICGVVKHAIRMRKDIPYLPALHKCAFSWYCDGKSDTISLTKSDDSLIGINVKVFTESIVVAVLTMNGTLVDNTNGATHYYNPSLANPNWAKLYDLTTVHQNHVFYRREKNNLL